MDKSKANVFEVLGLLVAAISCIAALMVVPEVRSFLGLANNPNISEQIAKPSSVISLTATFQGLVTPSSVPIINSPIVALSDYGNGILIIIDSKGEVYKIETELICVRQSALSPNKDLIAIDSCGDEQGGIYLVGLNGTIVKRLTKEYWDGSPSWSPDGKNIVYSCSGEICIVNTDGTNRRQITNDSSNNQDPQWLPNGQIVFSSDRDRPKEEQPRLGEYKYKIYIMDSDGSNVRDLSEESVYDWHPACSPNGQLIAFFSSRGSYVYIMNVDGSNVRTLASTKFVGELSWSSDSQHLFFWRDDGIQLYMVDVDGSNISPVYIP